MRGSDEFRDRDIEGSVMATFCFEGATLLGLLAAVAFRFADPAVELCVDAACFAWRIFGCYTLTGGG